MKNHQKPRQARPQRRHRGRPARSAACYAFARFFFIFFFALLAWLSSAFSFFAFLAAANAAALLPLRLAAALAAAAARPPSAPCFCPWAFFVLAPSWPPNFFQRPDASLERWSASYSALNLGALSNFLSLCTVHLPALARKIGKLL